MALTQRTVVDQIEVTRNGAVQVRLALLVENNGVEISKQFHRYCLMPGDDHAAMLAAVNADLSQRGLGLPVASAESAKVNAHIEAAWTPDVLAAHEASKAAAAAELTATFKG